MIDYLTFTFGIVSTHSRLKAAGADYLVTRSGMVVSTHSRLKAAGAPITAWRLKPTAFQHTAA